MSFIDMTTTSGILAPVINKHLPDASLEVLVIPIEESTSFVHGFPGITPFSVRAIVRVRNTTSRKWKNIHKLVVGFEGQTLVNAEWFAYDSHLQKSVTLVEPADGSSTYEGGHKATGASRLPPLGPGESRDFSVVFEFESAAQGGPTYLPSAMEKPFGMGDARTHYTIEARIFTPTKWGSNPATTAGSATIPFTWYDQRIISSFLSSPKFSPKPGWVSNIPHNLPGATSTIQPDHPLQLTLAFNDGAVFCIDDSLDFTYQVGVRDAHTSIGTPKSFVLSIEQTILIFGKGMTTGPSMKFQIFKYKDNPILVSKPNHVITTLSYLKKKEEVLPMILPTRLPIGEDRHFVVKHDLVVRVGVEGGKGDVEWRAPIVIVPWKKGEVREFFSQNPDVRDEILEGVAPAYSDSGDAPLYEEGAGGLVG
ncbi:hypothetical protein HDV00_003652 [Rhizophlyctis rosea]|nr:hypothetical protein HDV00_003652 [Rhizophlyctis rosea]